jgi:hypothetical protein
VQFALVSRKEEFAFGGDPTTLYSEALASLLSPIPPYIKEGEL